LAGRQLLCVGERYNRSGKRLLLRVDDKTVWFLANGYLATLK
jgi:hypothetical protein